ncbi:hypothetical protein RSJ21_19645 (plasmid) [Clostridium botulinum]|uniref:Uncharacterized protein n=1 Tax=Clostridium botulinum TaxID=1491 RepID=A0A6B4WIX7_CLOBO|nr:hypothetical protein RSJ13_18740 [Clostridium botulinum]AUN12725.1 hypothetical protein RSJ6_19955 [Clostridium botulinum]AUN27409.1 hypothetical protein RSJ21_19645 [Clostridium botulinum]AWB32350.1 hypothetical protein DBN47_19295 [Clostridium botulinum]MBN3433085.1 hypothetical protein [Clostridium botulinum]
MLRSISRKNKRPTNQSVLLPLEGRRTSQKNICKILTSVCDCPSWGRR